MHTSETFSPQDANYYRDTLQHHETVLVPQTEYIINPDKPLASENGYDVTAIIDGYDGDEQVKQNWDKQGVQPDQFLLLDLRNAQRVGKYKEFRGTLVRADIEFMIIGSNFDVEAGLGYKGIRKGEQVDMGRGDKKLEERFNLSDTTSRKHFSIRLDENGVLTMADMGSSNGTRVTSAETPIMNGMAGQKQESSATSDPNARWWEDAPKQEQPKHESGRYGYANKGRDDFRQQPQEQPKHESGRYGQAYGHYKDRAEKPTHDVPIVEKQAPKPKTYSEEWSKNRDSEYVAMPQTVRTMFDQIEGSFKSEIPLTIATGVLKEVDALRKAGKTEKQVRIEMVKRWHPDKHPNASIDEKAIAESVTKMIGQVVR